MDSHEIGCTIITFNEERRIETSIRHVMRWCKYVVVIDKGSTDRTREIAVSEGARVLEIEYTEQGEEDRMEIQSRLTECYPDFPEWYLGLTVGDGVTSQLLVDIKKRVSSGPAFDLGMVSTRYYSFGDYSEDNPWKTIYCPKLFNRVRTIFSAGHHDFGRDNKRLAYIGGRDRSYLLHQTHAGVESFLVNHIKYARYEGTRGIDSTGFDTAKSVLRLVLKLRKKRISRLQVVGMMTYRLMKLMFWLEKTRGRDVAQEYKRRIDRLEFKDDREAYQDEG